jgi:hypothetical protein
MDILPDMNEVHSFILGFAEGFCLCGPRIKAPPAVKKMVEREYWDYQGGRVAGKVAFPIVIIVILWLGKELLL